MTSFHFLGRGAAFNVLEGNTAAYVRDGANLLLIDCGETVFQQLIARQILTGVKQVWVVVSHLHSDHCGSLGSLGHYCRYVLGIKLTVLVPEDQAYVQQLAQLLSLFGNDENSCEMTPCKQWQGAGSIRGIQYVSTEHAKGMRCYSFVLDTEEGAVFYSADTCTTETLLAFLRQHDQVSAIFMDTTDADYPGNIHLPLKKLAEALPPAMIDRTWLMHLNGPAVAEQGEKLGFHIVSII